MFSKVGAGTQQIGVGSDVENSKYTILLNIFGTHQLVIIISMTAKDATEYAGVLHKGTITAKPI